MSELGQTLKEARETKGLSLDDLQEETKIQKRYLQAIEDGDFKQLPGDFYTRAFIKSYAEAVGLDFGELASQYAGELPEMNREHAEIHTIPPDGTEEMPAAKTVRRARSSTKGLSSFLSKAIIAVFILIAIMLIYILVTNMMSSHPGSTPNGKGNASSVSFKGSSASNAGGSSTNAGSSSPGSGSSASSVQQQSLKLDKTQGSTSTYTLSGTTKFDVLISGKNGNNTWINATDVQNGKQLAQGIASGNKSFHFDASGVQSLRLDIGSVPNTALKINGKDFTFPNQTYVQTIIINFSK